MSDRSDEVTKPRDTDDLLEETDRLLSDAGLEAGSDETSASTDSERGHRPNETHASTAADDSTRRVGLRSWLAADSYFSPKAFLAFVLLLGTGLLAGGTTIPIAGRIIGILGVAFAIGLLTSKRRYLELTAAGTSVGAVSAVASNAFLAAAGSFQTVVAVGVAVGLVASLVGYYFGRDLRTGLTREIE
ncbi:hypothetical protein [Natronorubrum sulfidifaciens]|uniref:DUF456 domain-containing protein n=1 Tax=Natronorubrum sulfidifaciens JCM 14089 TaxID=1230460 RepID=L9WE51_9EURY|nr:hypothetical protein [Natronorubrum sulfidifaciens]ELY47627.1 hypothetical protein C495_05197 [Natronorubrum sulfidifaciens JCM 14089]